MTLFLKKIVRRSCSPCHSIYSEFVSGESVFPQVAEKYRSIDELCVNQVLSYSRIEPTQFLFLQI